MTESECIVVGRGIAGLSLARELVLQGRQVTVIGPASHPGDASRNAQGVSAVKGLLFGHGQLFQAKLSGHRYLRRWIDEVAQQSEVHIPYNLSGCWEPFEGADQYRAIRDRVYKLRWSGACGVKTLRFPYSDVRGQTGSRFDWGFRHPFDGWVDMPALLSGLEAIIVRAGGTIKSDRILSLHPATNDGSGWTLEGERGHFACANLFVAAGYGVNELCRSLGFLLKTRDVIGGTIWWKDRPFRPNAFLLGKQSLVFGEGGACKFGSIDVKSLPTVPSEAEDLLRRLKDDCGRYLEDSSHMRNSGVLHWGTRVCSHDLMPIIGAMHMEPKGPPLFLCTAFHKSGLQLAPLAAYHVARILNGHDTPEPWCSFSPMRKGLLRKVGVVL